MVGVPVQQSKHYANVAMDSQRFVDDALAIWISCLEINFNYWLPDNVYMEFNKDYLIKQDSKTRFETYSIAISSGVLTKNEARLKEGLPELDEDEEEDEEPNLVPMLPQIVEQVEEEDEDEEAA